MQIPFSETLPKQVEQEMGDAVRKQLFQLSSNLLIEWESPIYLEKEWWQRASKFIDIPHSEYWRGNF